MATPGRAAAAGNSTSAPRSLGECAARSQRGAPTSTVCLAAALLVTVVAACRKERVPATLTAVRELSELELGFSYGPVTGLVAVARQAGEPGILLVGQRTRENEQEKATSLASTARRRTARSVESILPTRRGAARGWARRGGTTARSRPAHRSRSRAQCAPQPRRR